MGWAGWVLAHTEFGSSGNPILDYAHHITDGRPGFENLTASLYEGFHLLLKRSLPRKIKTS